MGWKRGGVGRKLPPFESGLDEQRRRAEKAEADNARREARVAELEGILRLIDSHGIRAKTFDCPEDALVRELCELSGYGAVMDAAARLWFKKDNIGALTVGPCAATVRQALDALDGEGGG